MDTVNWEFMKYNNLNNLLGVSTMTKRKSYDKEFKLEAVQLVQSGKRVAEVARELDLAEQTLHNWKLLKIKRENIVREIHLMANFRKLPSGKWQARIFVDGKLKSIGTFKTKKEAQLKASEAERKAYYNRTLTDRNMRFQEVIDNWFDHKRRTVKDSTLEQLEVVKRLHIEPHFAHRKIFNINRNDVIEWINTYEGNEDYSYGTRLKHMAVLRDIFYHAIHYMDVLDKNPAARVNFSRPDEYRNIKRDVKYYNLEELNTLLDFLREHRPQRFSEYKPYYALVFFLSRTGLRISEALALRWSDIQGNRVNINKQTSRDNNNNANLTSLKTPASYRNIEIDEVTVEMLHWFKKVQNRCIQKHDKFVRHPDVIIFQTYNGNYMTPSTVREMLQKYCLQAGVEYKGTHAFRHTHAVLSLEAGADLLFVSKRLGHGTIQTTADTHLDITPIYESHELEKITKYLNSEEENEDDTSRF